MFNSSKNNERFFEKEHCVYRYVENKTGKVIYVGKTNSSLRARITAHRYEKGFQKANDFYVEYIRLSNTVETDCVEKFFINKWKPELNSKDKVSGISDIIAKEMDHLEWTSYKEYEKTYRNPVAIKNTIAAANQKAEFLKTALIYGDTGYFVSSMMDGSLYLPFPDSEKAITKKEVTPCFGGYKYVLDDGIYEELEKYKEQIEAEIWLPSLLVCEMTEEEELMFSIINKQIEFGEELETFSLSGYEDDKSLYRYNFQSKFPGSTVLTPFRNVFDGPVYINKESSCINGEINPCTYEEQMPLSRREVSRNILSFAYQLKTPIVSQKLVSICKDFDLDCFAGFSK